MKATHSLDCRIRDNAGQVLKQCSDNLTGENVVN
jgi:hypothetical protein